MTFHAIRPGEYSDAEMTQAYDITLINTSASLISSSAKPSDMIGNIEWFEPVNNSDELVPYAEAQEGWSSQVGLGGYTWEWVMYWTPGMFNLMTTYLGMSTLLAKRVTVRTYDGFHDVWRVIQADMLWPVKRVQTERDGGAFYYTIRFVNGVLAPTGPDLAMTITLGGTQEVGQQMTVDTEVENVGDYTTYDDIVVIVPIPSGTEFALFTGATFSLEYSTDGGSGYSGTPPGDLGDVTHVRYTRSTSLASGASVTPQVTLDCVSADSGNVTASVSTTGDVVSANDSDSEAYNITVP